MNRKLSSGFTINIALLIWLAGCSSVESSPEYQEMLERNKDSSIVYDENIKIRDIFLNSSKGKLVTKGKKLLLELKALNSKIGKISHEISDKKREIDNLKDRFVPIKKENKKYKKLYKTISGKKNYTIQHLISWKKMVGKKLY